MTSPQAGSKPETPATAEGDTVIPDKVEVEIDIFSGMPNPTWMLSNADADHFLKQIAALPQAPAKELAGNLGYRGFVVHVTGGTEDSLMRVQNGTVQVSHGSTTAYHRDPDRGVERWLLMSGRAFLTPDLFALVEREVTR